MFYTLHICPACDSVDVFPDDEMELSSNLEFETLCQQCSFDDECLPEEVHYLLEDHCFHVEQHPDCFFEYSGAASVLPF